ncbi:ComEC/Rec2 family competence protein [Mycobacterium sp. CBMA247]|nr:ComEC/Rec2 family competence protein [Mycolicibacterium sp. CBMA 329]MUL90600.1 ComEC/Rec2 family competence protein [Mycolicibacterium sp. CBMA 331]MUM00570.1 ComEC/Rec2 family competence protein [Mycolicibacterium sp. CBMA 334]MUM25461.1 ComEC/Rec2 family competence protein [Mycolicibacterium sp. CBMA 295]MUM41544.1 ComEC/Rec2 family competence protein [Mycolicibacterium sp. CBMA 247]MUM46008.1 ComEC/Rec2 family competence protein [Mycolicibacterium sp. CBMA 294]
MDLRTVPAALTAWAVSAAGIAWHPGAAVAVGLGAVGLTWVAARRSGESGMERQPTAAAVLAVAAVAVGFTVAVGLRVYQVEHHPLGGIYGGAAMVEVVPSETPRVINGGRLMFRAMLRQVDQVPMSGRVLVFAPASVGEVGPGRPVRFRAAVRRPARKDLSVAVLAASGRSSLGEASAVQRVAQRIRSAFGEASRAVLPVEQAAMLPALVLGDTSAVTGQATAQFRTSGLTHLTAVSGANVTIVCGALLLSAALVGPRAAVLLAGAGLVGFVIVVQPSASVLRAALMGAVTLLAVLTHRRRQAVPALAASVIALMIAAPELAVDVGFALSVCATAGIVVLAPVWSARLQARGWPRPLAAAVSVAVVAQLVTAPLVAGISGTISVVAVAANLAVAGVIPPITVLGTAAAVCSAISPAMGQLLIRFTGPELWWLLSVARWASALPAAALPSPSGLAGVVSVALGGIALTVLWRLRWVRRGLAGLVLGLLAWGLAGQVVEPVGST